MPVDGRPFLKLQTPSQAAARTFTRCLRPEVRPLALGVTKDAAGGTVLTDQPTHKIDLPLPLGNPPADLVDGVTVTVDVERGKPREAFTVLRGGIDKGAGLWTLYVRREDAYRPPLPPAPDGTPAPYDGWEP